MTTQEHYDRHLASYYEWMMGNFDALVLQFQVFFKEHFNRPYTGAVAIDLGCGHGPQSIAMAKLGLEVVSIDFNAQLLNAFKHRVQDLNVKVIEDDFTRFAAHCSSADVIICMGDTIAHVSSFDQLQRLFNDSFKCLTASGQLYLSFRDYSQELTDTARFIPVKSDHDKIATCVLDFSIDMVNVTDLLYIKEDETWKQHVSSYTKLRLTPTLVSKFVQAAGFSITHLSIQNRMHFLVATKALPHEQN
jgi:SAM-dependent methyltransferase